MRVVSHTPSRIEMALPDSSVPIVTQVAEPDHRPYIHPLRTSDGIVLTEDRPPHHVWQHGLYIGLNGVNGFGFWTEGLNERNRATDGSFHPRPLQAPRCTDKSADWSVVTAYREPQGKELLEETQRWSCTLSSHGYTLDFTWTLSATVDLQFGQYRYGGLFLRMPYREDQRACLLTSAGATDPKEADGKPAQWCAVSMDLASGAAAGLAILDHPANQPFVVPWRVDNQYGISPSFCIAGPWSLVAGKSRTFRYRLIPFAGPPSREVLSAEQGRFSQTTIDILDQQS